MEGKGRSQKKNRQRERFSRRQVEKVCNICGNDGEGAAYCCECGIAVCRACSYEYESKGGVLCPQCHINTYKLDHNHQDVEADNEEHRADSESYLNKDEKLRLQALGTLQTQEEAVPQLHKVINAGDMNSENASILGLSIPGIKRVNPFPDLDSDLDSSVHQEMTMDSSSPKDGSLAWKQRVEIWKYKHERTQMVMKEGGYANEDYIENEEEPADMSSMDEARQPLSRKVSISSSKISPYRMVIVIRLVILGFFFRYRIMNPVSKAYGLWLTSIICEIWFALSWILDQFPKWYPIGRETYLDRLSLRYDREGEASELAGVDVFVSTVDPMKEPPLVTANTLLSILAVNYPVDKVSCYVSDDGASMLTFDSLAETSEFARTWVPFCKKFNIEPRAPEIYFAKKIDYLKDKVQPSFVKERRAMKREYEEFKVRINGLVAKSQKMPEEGWSMQDGTPWPGNNSRDHPGMIQVFLGHSGGHDTEGNELPRLVYVSREKRPGFQHHKKAGAMNALVRVSALLTNAPFFLNLDCDHYINNSKALREAMCFLMDPIVGKKVCYVQFPQRFDGIDLHDRYANHNTVFFDINMKGLDGVQGPVYVGTGCVFRRQAVYGYEPPSHKKPAKFSDPGSNLQNTQDRLAGYDDDRKSLLMLQNNFEKQFGKSPAFVASILLEYGGVPESSDTADLLKEAIHVISCGYEDMTNWGKEIGWIYGSVTEDILTGFRMHCRGWRSIYCMPREAAFKGSAPINLSDRLNQVQRWALGSIEIFLSRHCPLWYGYGGGLKCLQRLAYINTIVYPFTSIPLLTYCTLPAICLLTGKFIIPKISGFASLWFLSLFLSIFATGLMEMRWSGVGIEEWWRNEQFWVIGGVSAHLFALVQGFLKVAAGIHTNFTVTAKASDDKDFGELYAFKWTALLIPPTTLLIINLVAIVAGISDAVSSNYQAWGPLFGKLFFAFWVIVHLYPFLKGLMGRQNRIPTIVIVWSILLASIFSLLWVRINPFLTKVTGPDLHICGNKC